MSLELSTPCDQSARVFAHQLLDSGQRLTGSYKIQLDDVTVEGMVVV